MIRLNQQFKNHAKDNAIRNRYIFFKICCMFITAFIFIGMMTGTAKAQSGLKIYDYTTKTTSYYTGKQVTVTLNGSTISNTDTPGILVEGIALLPYDDIYENSGIAAECSYDESKGTLSISKYDITISMTIGSKKARVNGKSVTLPVAPKKIKYVTSDITKVLVPSRYIATALGLGYTWYNDKNRVAIKKNTILLSYNGGEQFEYKGTQGNVMVNGKKINLGSMPSIIMNDTAMLRVKKVFADSEIKAEYTYDRSSQTLTLSRNGNVLVMTIGSKTAYLNGKPETLDTAPLSVKNNETGISYAMVPGNFTANSLGYSYRWNNTTRTSLITSGSSDAELGDSGDISETGTILKEWTTTAEQYGISSNIHDINSSAATTNNYGTINAVSRDYSNTKLNAETFMITSTVPYNRITSASSGKKIIIMADNQQSNNQIYQMLGSSSNMVNTISLVNNTGGTGTSIELDVLRENYQYEISMSDNKQTLYVTVYQNALTSALIGSNSNGDYLTLQGTDSLQASVSEASGCIYIDLPDTINMLGNILSDITGSKYIKQFNIISDVDHIQVVLSLNDGYQYSCKNSNNQFTITFQAKGVPVVVTDQNNNNIVIPRPEAVTPSMISDEDYYFDNYFVITLVGNYIDYFNSNPIVNNASTVDNIAVSLNQDGNTEIKIGTSILQGYRITPDSNSIYVKVGNPRDIYKNIVVLDPGHGGDATGTIQNGAYEKDINLDVLYTIGKKYFNQDTAKLKVYYTRISDVDMPLKERGAFAKKVGADLFVSLHMNSAPAAPKASGTEVFYSVNNNSPNSAGLTSEMLASMLLDDLYPAIGTNDRGVKHEDFTVIYKNTVPAVLIELGFLTNSGDYDIIMDQDQRETAAATIYNALLEVFELYPTGR